MSSLSGKIVASGLSAFNETTLALANLNFNFALIKVEPPTEYMDLGSSLSKVHRQAAEDGTEHVFARNLAALFSQIIPSTPNLIRAYGIRASEIAKFATKNNSSAHTRGIFQDCTGPDATSIWAAATSGPGAISVHLLACMLARAWNSDQAEAIWDEIIQARKRELRDMDASEHVLPAIQFAARIDIDRDQISRWNASAKAWLEVADGVMKREQTQLELLVGRTGLSIDGSAGTYPSVMKAWTTALNAMEALTSGVPQSIQDGAVILGLKSWHLFPNIFALEAGQDKIHLHDKLIPESAVITLGISSWSPDSESGVFWSLSLSFLRYYGDPVPSSSQPQESTTRLLLPELWLVLLGSVYAGWAEHGEDIEKASKFIYKLGEYTVSHRPRNRPRSWLELLSEAAESHICASRSEKDHSTILIRRGRRLYQDFLALRTEQPAPLFDITTIETLLEPVVDVDNKVSILRTIAKKKLNARPDALLIRYAQKLPDTQLLIPKTTQPGLEPPEHHRWEYATALRSKKRKRHPNQGLSGHTRWKDMDFQSYEMGLDGTNGERYESLEGAGMVAESCNSFRWNAKLRGQEYSRGALFECILGDPVDAAIFRKSGTEVSGSTATDIDLLVNALESSWIDCARLLRHLDNLCERISQAQHPGVQPGFTKTLRALAAATDAYTLMPGATVPTTFFSRPLRDALWFPNMELFHDPEYLKAAEAARKTEETTSSQFSLQLGTIDPRVLIRTSEDTDKKPLTQQDSEEEASELVSYRLTRMQTFACIAMFEDRNVDLDPRALNQVMAISCGNSIYVAMPLLCDPYDSPSGHEVKRIVGNISKPGISLMTPPILPKILKLDESRWMPINHNDFEGQLDDCFQHTSMHLSFTRYKLPASVTSHGDQAVGATFVETLVSVFDKGEWIADLDVLGALDKPYFLRFDQLPRCPHAQPARKPDFALTCIDSWNEFIDRPVGASVFRARENWLARLAGAALNAQRGHRTAVLPSPSEVCWTCIESACETRDDICLSKFENQLVLIPMFIC